MQQWKWPRMQPVADAEVESPMPHGASTAWHIVLDLTGMRRDLSRESSIPTVSFDKSLDEGDKEAQVSSSAWLVMTDSHSGYLGCCPGQIELATHEIMAFTQSLGIQQCDLLLSMSPQHGRS